MEGVRLPSTYLLALLLLVVASLVGLRNLRQSWAPGYLAVLGTVFVWYFLEPIYSPEEFVSFSDDILELGFFSVAIFLATFMSMSPLLVSKFRPRIAVHLRKPAMGLLRGLNVDKVAKIVIAFWLVLLTYGVWRVDWDVFGALFPIESRTGNAVAMWGRAGGSGAGSTGFIVSSGFYLYQLCLSAFGLLLPIVRNPRMRLLLLLLIAISWPYAFLQGARNIALAVVAPFFASFMLYSRVSLPARIMVLGAGYYIISWAMLIIVNLRNVGFSSVRLDELSNAKHLGLNMASELMYMTSFVSTGIVRVSYGTNYAAHIANAIPRAVWAGKPLVGIDYAIARGFGGADNDIGVFATISMGMIGQGVENFGSFVGPMAAGLIMAAWVGILNRMRVYGGLPRTALFLVGLGLTFNMGRDITLLVMFPFIFGLIIVWVLEALESKRLRTLEAREFTNPNMPDRSTRPGGIYK